MNKTTLYETLRQHQAKGYAPFHTPGHKNSGFFPPELLQLDLTELPDTDALFEASDVIARTEQELTEVFGSGSSLLSAGGCTLAIQTMLALACMRGKKILLGRNAHRSAVNAAALLDFEPIWLLPEETGGFTGRVSPQAAEAVLTAHPDAAAVYLTSPTYYGELSDISEMAAVCHRHHALLLIDNAHGSHLAFMQQNLHPLHLGADMTACSLHKTLPVLTGGAALQLADRELAALAKQKMALFGSTSPSYLIMSSIDLCCRYLQNEGTSAYRETEQRVGQIKALAAQQGLPQPEGSCDPLRVCLHTASAGLTGQQQQTEYFHRFGVEPEMCDGQNAVMLCTPFNTENDFLHLEHAIEGLSGSGTFSEAAPQALPEVVMTPREAVFAVAEPVAVENAVGKIAAESACPCPPGIPIVMPGERIGKQEAELLRRGGIDRLLCVK